MGLAIVDDVGFLCLTIDSGEDHEIVGRTKLQKIVYFCQYLGWDIDDYMLHYYGPFSFGLVSTIKNAENAELINQGDAPPYTFSLTNPGIEFLERFETNVCDPDKVEHTRSLVEYLSDWDKDELEIAATYFCKKENRRMEFFETIVNPHLSYSNKLEILETILKTSYTHILKKYPKLYNDLKKFNELRNNVAHSSRIYQLQRDKENKVKKESLILQQWKKK